MYLPSKIRRKLLLMKWIFYGGFLILLISQLGCNQKELLVKQDENAFIEIFNALEIDYQEDSNSNDIQYLDYVIQKYQLWRNENLRRYKEAKEFYKTRENQWQEILLRAQEYKRDPLWKEKYQDISKENEDIYLKLLEKTEPDEYKLLQSFKDGNEEEGKKIIKKYYPNKSFDKNEWNQDSDKWFSQVIRQILRHNFKREIEKLNI